VSRSALLKSTKSRRAYEISESLLFVGFERLDVSYTTNLGFRTDWVIRDRIEPAARQTMCAVPRKRKFLEHQRLVEAGTPNRISNPSE
jgi:hypothetical protein